LRSTRDRFSVVRAPHARRVANEGEPRRPRDSARQSDSLHNAPTQSVCPLVVLRERAKHVAAARADDSSGVHCCTLALWLRDTVPLQAVRQAADSLSAAYPSLHEVARFLNFPLVACKVRVPSRDQAQRTRFVIWRSKRGHIARPGGTFCFVAATVSRRRAGRMSRQCHDLRVSGPGAESEAGAATCLPAASTGHTKAPERCATDRRRQPGLE
jgi:hypothetical protein